MVLFLCSASGLMMMVDGGWKSRLVAEVDGAFAPPGWFSASDHGEWSRCLFLFWWLFLGSASGLVMVVDGGWELRLIAEVDGAFAPPGWPLAADYGEWSLCCCRCLFLFWWLRGRCGRWSHALGKVGGSAWRR